MTTSDSFEGYRRLAATVLLSAYMAGDFAALKSDDMLLWWMCVKMPQPTKIPLMPKDIRKTRMPRRRK